MRRNGDGCVKEKGIERFGEWVVGFVRKYEMDGMDIEYE